MGLRLRLKASFSLAGYHGEALIVLRALKRYGLIVADNGSSWYITGAPDPRWNDEDLEPAQARARRSIRGGAHRADPAPRLGVLLGLDRRRLGRCRRRHGLGRLLPAGCAGSATGAAGWATGCAGCAAAASTARLLLGSRGIGCCGGDAAGC